MEGERATAAAAALCHGGAAVDSGQMCGNKREDKTGVRFTRACMHARAAKVKPYTHARPGEASRFNRRRQTAITCYLVRRRASTALEARCVVDVES